MNIEIYTLSYCHYCIRAKEFFKQRNIDFREYPLDGDEEKNFAKLQNDFNIKGEVTAPQIIIDGVRIGGYSDLIEKFQSGELKL